MNRNGRGVKDKVDALRCRQILLETAGRHAVAPAPVDDGHRFGAQELGLNGGVNGGHPTTDNHHIAPNRQCGKISCLPQVRNELHGVQDVVLFFAFSAKCINSRQPHTKKDRVEFAQKSVQRQIARAQRATVNHFDAADFHQPGHLGLGEIVHGLVAGDAVFVQPAGLWPGIENDHVVALHRQPVRAGKPGGPGPNNCNALARRIGTLVRMRASRHRAVGGIALQAPNLDRLALGGLPHAGLLAERLGRANTRAHTAQDVLIKNRFRSTAGMPGLNLSDEQRNIDRRRASRHARRVIAEITSVSGNHRLVTIERFVKIGKVFNQRLSGQPARLDAFGAGRVRHRALP